MDLSFAILAGLVLGSALAAMALPKLIHAALCLTLALAGLAGLFLKLGAEFIGFAQILVYVGAVAILIVFAILLTRGDVARRPVALASSTWLVGVAIAGLVAGCLILSVHFSQVPRPAVAPPSLTTAQIGRALMTDYVVPLEAVGLLLTVALIGATLIALPESAAAKSGASKPPAAPAAGTKDAPPPEGTSGGTAPLGTGT